MRVSYSSVRLRILKLDRHVIASILEPRFCISMFRSSFVLRFCFVVILPSAYFQIILL